MPLATGASEKAMRSAGMLGRRALCNATARRGSERGVVLWRRRGMCRSYAPRSKWRTRERVFTVAHGKPFHAAEARLRRRGGHNLCGPARPILSHRTAPGDVNESRRRPECQRPQRGNEFAAGGVERAPQGRRERPPAVALVGGGGQGRRRLQRRGRAERRHGRRAGAPAPGGRQGRQAQAARVAARRARLLGRIGRVHQLADRRPRAPDQRGGARDRRGRAGRPLEEHGARGRRPAARRRVPAHREDDQQDGRAARQLLGRGDARGARGRHRRQARRPGQGEGRRRHLEGPDRLGELDGRQPDRPGAQHRRRDDRGRQGRPVEEDRRRRQGRVPDAEEHHQHDGRPAALVRVRSDAGGARGRHRGLARRPGARRRRVGHVEGPDRLGELDGRQPDRARCATSPT